LFRLLQFGLGIEPRTTEAAAGTAVERSGGKPAEAIDGSPEDAQPADAPSKTEAPSANLAFALRMTDVPESAAGSTATPATQPSSVAAISGATAATAATNSAQQNTGQSDAQDADRNTKQERDDAAAAAAKTDAATPAATLSAMADSTSTVIAATASAPALAISQAPIKEAAPAAHTAPANELADKPAAAPAQHISLSLTDSDNQRVDVHLMERGGEVRVSVRTADEVLTHSMRADLGSLNGKLAQSGYSTESFAPTGANTSGFSNQRQSSEERDSAAGGKHNQPQNQSGGQQQPSRDGRRQRPAWVEELENSLSSNAAIRSNQPWQRA
jgi:hypothetical protein